MSDAPVSGAGARRPPTREPGSRPPWLILADDLTGCLDTSAAFARPREPIKAHLDWTAGMPAPGNPACRAVGLDLETRRLSPAAAARAVSGPLEPLSENGAFRLYKKLDSVLRGPIEAELNTVRRIFGGLVVVAPAVPSAGRTTRDGIQRSRGVPVQHGNLMDRLAPFGVRLADLALVRSSPALLAESMERCLHEGMAYLVVDAETDTDLESLAGAMGLWNGPAIAAGAAGLAQAIASSEWPGSPPSVCSPAARPLIATASFHAATQQQIATLVGEAGGEAIVVPAAKPAGAASDSPPASLLNRILSRVQEALDDGRCPVLCLEQSGVPDSVEADYARVLGEIAAAAVVRCSVDCLVLSGGDSAYSTLRALGVTVLEVDGTALPNTPACSALGGPAAGLRVITKSGGFGEPDALLRIVKNARRQGRDDEKTSRAP